MYWGQSSKSCESLKRENSYLQDELDRERRDREERQEREQRAQRERREERQREYNESLCHAEDWPEAFRKGRIRAGEEARIEAQENAAYERGEYEGTGFKPTTFFQDWVKEVERAQVIYSDVMREAEEEIARIRAAALGKVADRLAEEYGESGTVEALREDNPEYLTYW